MPETIKRTPNPQNPYPKGSARASLWAKREAKRLRAERAREKPKPKEKADKSKRRAYLDDKIEGK